MIYVDVVQGSTEWIAHRATHFNASDAPAMLGVSPYKTRTQLLREMHTGVAAEVDTATHMRFENGHRAEALARPLAENLIGEDLYPVTGSDGRLSASFDGLTMDERQGFEHKALSAELRAAFDVALDASIGHDAAGCRLLPLHHRIQMEQQLHISGADRILFMSSDWTADGQLVDERHCWYYPDAELRAQILRGWDQFAADLAAYELPESAPAAPVGRAPETLPALRIELTGQVTASNLAEFKATALGAIRSVNRDLRTDADFADAAKAVAWCSEVESRLKAAKEHALSQTASIDELFRALDDISAEARTVRLDLEKLVARRKQEMKEQAVADARRALEAHISAIDAELAPLRLPRQQMDFAAAIKGLRSVANMQDALDSALAAGKIAADAAARGIRANVAAYCQHAAGMDSLFPDMPQIAHKAPDDFVATLHARIAQHRAAEEAKKKAAADCARLAALLTDQGAQVPQAATPGAAAEGLVSPPSAEPGTPAPTQPEAATLKLGDINARLAPIKLDVAGLAQLGLQPAKVEGAARLYTERQYAQLCSALIAHITERAWLKGVACCAA